MLRNFFFHSLALVLDTYDKIILLALFQEHSFRRDGEFWSVMLDTSPTFF